MQKRIYSQRDFGETRSRELVIGGEIGSRDAPKGTRDWSIYFGYRAKQLAESTQQDVLILQTLLGLLKDHDAHLSVGCSTWHEFCVRNIGITEEQADGVLGASAGTTIGAALADKARQLKTEHPQMTQEAIAKAVGCSQPYVSKMKKKEKENITKVEESAIKVIIPAHIKDRHEKSDFRKLSADLQSQVISRTISLNRACIQAGIRVKLSPLDVAKKAVLALCDEDWQAVKLWRESQ